MNPEQKSKVESVNTDVVVIGCGKSGLPAAVAAVEQGAKVVILEEQSEPTGAVAGLFAAESPAQRRQDITLTKDEAFQIVMDWAHWNINSRLMRAIVDKSSDAIKWLEDKGLRTDVTIPIYNYLTVRCFHLVLAGETWKWQKEGEVWSMGGQAQALDVLRKSYEDGGGKYYFNCKAKKILTNSKGEVAGVLAEKQGKELRVNAKKVIIATGGYGANIELLKKYHPSYNENVAFSGAPWCRGDGIFMAKEVGASTDEPGSVIFSHHGYKYEGGKMLAGQALAMGPLSHIGRAPQTIWVNKNGERFCPEWLADHANAVYAQPDHCLYALFDSKFLNRFLTGKHYSFMTGINGEPCPPGLEDELRSENAKGKGVKIANSWGEIGKWMGIAPAVLEATVAEYNAACDEGYDPIFNKKKVYLDAMRTPPYYAVRCYQDQHNAVGNIKVNYRMEVLDKQAKPIPGLYACGDTCGGWSTDYCIALAGMWDAFAFISGRIAGENAGKTRG